MDSIYLFQLFDKFIYENFTYGLISINSSKAARNAKIKLRDRNMQ